MNISAGNSILKFLEEPEENIVAILITKNLYKVLETIVSRCQILNFNNYFYDFNDSDFISKSLEYLQIYEDKKEKAVAYFSELYQFKSEELKNVFYIWNKIYEESLVFKINGINNFFEQEKIKKISSQNTKSEIINKIKKIDFLMNLFDFNVNNRVIIDNYIFGGENNEDKCN